MKTLSFASPTEGPTRRTLLGRIADLWDSVLQRLTLFPFYYVPIVFAMIRPSQRRTDIREEHPGSLSFDNRKYAIYVLWQPTSIPWYVINMLEGLKRRGVNTIIVCNHKLPADQLATLQALSALVLIRGNKGLDFGAYRDAVLLLTERHKEVERLLILNDSVYVFSQGLDKLLSDLLSNDYPVVAAYENWEIHYHLQSFCLGLSGDILRHPRIESYWRRYLPVSVRRWCIHQGEVRLSSVLRRVSPSFRVVYGINPLLEALATESDWVTLLQYREFVPRSVRSQFPDDDVLQLLGEADPGERAVILRRLRERLSDLLMKRAQAHTGVFFFPKFLSSPFLKRDIVYRELFTLYEAERMLLALGRDEEIQSITDEFRRRGTAAHLKGIARRRYRLGLI